MQKRSFFNKMEIAKWLGGFAVVVIANETGYLVPLAAIGTVIFIASKVAKGQQIVHAAWVPAALWGAALKADQAFFQGSAGPLEAIESIAIGAISAVVLLFLLKFFIGLLGWGFSNDK